MEPNEYAQAVLEQIRAMNEVEQKLDVLMLIDRTGEVAKIKGHYQDAIAPIINELRAHVRRTLIDENPHG